MVVLVPFVTYIVDEYHPVLNQRSIRIDPVWLHQYYFKLDFGSQKTMLQDAVELFH